MNMTTFLNNYYGPGWKYDNKEKLWTNPDGRIVEKVQIGKIWKYVYVTDEGSKFIDPYGIVEIHENKTSIPKLR